MISFTQLRPSFVVAQPDSLESTPLGSLDDGFACLPGYYPAWTLTSVVANPVLPGYVNECLRMLRLARTLCYIQNRLCRVLLLFKESLSGM